ncbi:MAG: HlyD family efflux transporter periplasmic adaptor subunit [Patescibacteria group bacterium]
MDLKTTYESTKIDLQERAKNAELTLEQAKNSYENAKSLRNATLTQLDGSRKSAEISLELARRNADNLLVRAPVSGTISKVLTSVGQSVATGAPIAEFTSNEPEIVLDIESNLARTLSVGETVEISVEDKQYK